jgi:hypothetical protein
LRQVARPPFVPAKAGTQKYVLGGPVFFVMSGTRPAMTSER